VMSSVYANATFGVFTDTFFEQVGFSLEGDRGHSRKGVGHTVDTWLLESDHEMVRTEFDVLTHGTSVRADEKANGDRSPTNSCSMSTASRMIARM
jgi:hypothetical protein